jgi:hypothetical protein
MKMVVLHQVIPGGPERKTAFNEEDIVRLEELELGTAVHQGDRGPVMVKETLKEVMEELGQKMPEEKPEPEHPESGHPEAKPHPEPHPEPTSRRGGTR